MAENKKHIEEHGDGHEGGHGAGRYILIWAALLVFTVTTVVTGRMDLGSANLPLAMVIATIKATLVVLFFMHMWEAEGILKLVFSVSLVFVVVLLLGVFGDILTRSTAALPSAGNGTAIYMGADGTGHPSTPEH